MSALFSKQNQPQVFRNTLPESERRRIMFVMMQWANDLSSGTNFDQFLNEIGQKLILEYGGFYHSEYDAANVGDNPVVNHFALCPDPMALDFIQLAFTTRGGCGKHRTVDAINGIFRDSGIGYELTPYLETIEEPGTTADGRTTMRRTHTEYPRVIERGTHFLHTEATQPALNLLTDPRFTGANQEFLAALEYYRNGDNTACLNECLKAFESTMKIICHQKGWSYEQKDTASQLVGRCLDNGLLPSYSQEHLNALSQLLRTTIPTPRNRQSGHGRGVQDNVVTPDLAKFALNSTAATIVFLIEASQL